jgi:phosphoadenosine phosphosulfate reductase
VISRAVIAPAQLGGLLAALEGGPAQEVVAWALGRYPGRRAVIVTSLQAGGMAVVDMALRVDPDARIVTIDTGRLPDETYAYLDLVRAHFGRRIEVAFPDRDDVERFTTEHGVNPFRASVERRLDCCHLRKVEPLRRVLSGVDCWLTGLRREGSARRRAIPVVELDGEHGDILKVNPLASWGEADVRAYLRERGVPLHPLHERGYPSIGCAPCTRPVGPGEDPRAGRWWWEQGVEKECGLHGRPARPDVTGRTA